MFKGLLERKFIQMERPIKGGYILISLGLVALTAGANLTLDYERITKTKKHIVLTGIKVGSEIMPDIAVEPIIGSGKITFKSVYGYDLEVASNGSVTISESVAPEDIPNVEEAPSGTIVDMLGLDEDGKVVKGDLIPNVEEAPSGTIASVLGLDSNGDVVKGSLPSGGGTKLYNHEISVFGSGGPTCLISNRQSAITSLEDIVNAINRGIISGASPYGFVLLVSVGVMGGSRKAQSASLSENTLTITDVLGQTYQFDMSSFIDSVTSF